MESLLELITSPIWWLVDFFEQLHLYNQIIFGVITLVMIPLTWNLLAGKEGRYYFPESLWWKVCVGAPLSVVYPLGLVVYCTQLRSKIDGVGGFFWSLLQLSFWGATMTMGLMLTSNADLLFWLFILGGSWYAFTTIAANLATEHPRFGQILLSFFILVVWVGGMWFLSSLTSNNTLQFLVFIISGVIVWMASAWVSWLGSDSESEKADTSPSPGRTQETRKPQPTTTLSELQQDEELAAYTARLTKLKKS